MDGYSEVETIRIGLKFSHMEKESISFIIQKQNNNHITELRKTLKQFENIPFFSLIVFFGDCELKEINYVPKGTYVVKSQRVFEVLNLIKNENEPTEYTNKREVVNKLKELVSLGENVEYQKKHIENIKDMVGKDRIFK